MSWSALLCIHTPRPGAGPCRLPADDPIHQPSAAGAPTAEEEWHRTGRVTCADCGTKVRTETLESLPPHRCTERSAAGAPSPATGDVDTAALRRYGDAETVAHLPDVQEALRTALDALVAARAERDEALEALAEHEELDPHRARCWRRNTEEARQERDDARARLDEIRALCDATAERGYRYAIDVDKLRAILDRPAPTENL